MAVVMSGGTTGYMVLTHPDFVDCPLKSTVVSYHAHYAALYRAERLNRLAGHKKYRVAVAAGHFVVTSARRVP